MTIKQAALHNEDDIRRKDIRIGDTVIVQRAGEVIPQVVGPVVSKRTGQEKEFSLLEKLKKNEKGEPVCPEPGCGGVVKKLEGEVMYYCPNATCPAQAQQRIEHFVSRGAMDIRGIGESLSATLFENGLVKDMADLYSLKKEDLLKLEGMGEKSVDNLLEAIGNSKNQSLARVIFALGILHVGEEMAQILAQEFPSLDDLAKAAREGLKAKATRERLKAKSTREELKAKATRERLKAKSTREELKTKATRERLKATRERLKALTPREKLKAKVTRERLKAKATREGLKAKATREELKALATKERLKAKATREELKALATKEELLSIPTVGPKLAESITTFFGQEENRRIIQRLKDAGVNPKAVKTEVEELPLAGQEFVITGRLETFARQEAEARVKALGGSTGSSVTRKTTYLVVGAEPGSKLTRAQALGTKQLTEEEFIRLLRQTSQK